MKKIMMTLAAVLCCAMTTTVFTSCGGDDDNGNNNQPPVDVAVSAEMKCALYTTEQSLAAFDFYVKYYDENGNIQSEKVVWSEQNNADGQREWTKTVVQKLPATLGALFEIKPKDGIDLNAQYIISRGYDITITSWTASGKAIDQHNDGKYLRNRNRPGTLMDVLRTEGRPLDIILNYNANGIIVGTSTWQ